MTINSDVFHSIIYYVSFSFTHSTKVTICISDTSNYGEGICIPHVSF